MARISELHYSNAYAASSGVPEFLEVSLAPTEDPADFTVGFYNADGSLILEVPLDDPGVTVTFDPASNENVYVISSTVFGVLLTDPDGAGANNAEAFALTNTDTGTVIDFYDIGGGTQNIQAVGGAADGAVSTNVSVPTAPNDATYSIQFNQPDPTTPVAVPVNPGDSGVCFTPGTLIETADGPHPVETLREGDLILTRDHGFQPLRWVARRTVPAAGVLAPILIPAGRFGLSRDLRVSPQHRVLVTGWQAELLTGEPEVLVPARHLLDGDRVRRCVGGTVTYIHLLFDSHQLVLTQGLWTESFHPGEQGLDTMTEAAREELIAIFPELATLTDAYGPAVRPSLRAHEARLLGRMLLS